MTALPKIACLCVTQEKRAPVFGIAAASFAAQGYDNAELVWSVPPGDRTRPHQDVLANACVAPDQHVNCVSSSVKPSARLHELCLSAWEAGADLCTVWDDDDIKPPTWLHALGDTFSSVLAGPSNCVCGGATQGWFCNLRTLNGEFLQMPGHLWGGSLTFNRAAWEAAGGFRGKPTPGKDRAFIEALAESGSAFVKAQIDVEKFDAGHVAFSHGDNCATWLRSAGEPLASWLRRVYGDAVWTAVEHAQQFLISRRIFPPWSGSN